MSNKLKIYHNKTNLNPITITGQIQFAPTIAFSFVVIFKFCDYIIKKKGGNLICPPTTTWLIYGIN